MMKKLITYPWALSIGLLVSNVAAPLHSQAAEPSKPAKLTQDKATVAKPWTIRPLAIDANEGIAIGDINGDGLVDVVSGRNWYRAPDFVSVPLRQIEDWNGYVQSNGDFLFDVNDDGRLDVIAGSYLPTDVAWYENPGPEGLRLGQTWKRHLLIETGRSENEGQLLQDLDNDGLPEWIVNSWNAKNPVCVYRFVKRTSPKEDGCMYDLTPFTISETGNKHGLGAGDIDGDGRCDVLTGAGWYQQPTSDPWKSPWTFHPDWNTEASIPMLVADVDQDGKNDILVGEGHDFGLYWWKQTGRKANGGIELQSHVIDKSFSQPHTIAWHDIHGDGKFELITGKRYYAHNGGDPGGQDMPELNYYTFDVKQAAFTKFAIEQGHVGVGLQIAIADLNADGKLDIAVPGKSGTYLLFQP